MGKFALASITSLAVSTAIATLAITFGPPSLQAAETAPAAQTEVGKPAPDFTLPDSNGKQHKLSQYKDKFVVIEWINYDCPFVQKHYKSNNMQKLQEKYTGKGVTWLSINSSAKGRQGNYPGEKINELIKSNHAHPTAYLMDEDGKVGRLYGAKTTPHMFIVDPKGKLIYAGAIDDKNTADESDIKSATNYVSTALDQAMAGKPVTNGSTKSYGCSVKYAN